MGGNVLSEAQRDKSVPVSGLVSRQVVLRSRPDGKVTESCFEFREVPIAGPADGEVLVRNLWLSIDPSVRVRLGADPVPGYLPPFAIGDSLIGLAIGEILESRSPQFAVGDIVTHIHGYRDLAVIATEGATLAGVGALTKVDASVHPPETYLGVLGSSGLTAYVGLLEVATLADGDDVWVSAAAGAVGSIAAQMAKARGHRVIGSAGSDAKVAYLLERLKLDGAFDYHTDDLLGALEEHAPGGIDVYFDNVGGRQLEAAISHLKPHGRVALSGAVSEYDTVETAYGPRNMFQVVSKSLTLRGFRSGAYNHLWDAMREELGGYLRDGRLHFEQTVFEGLEDAPSAVVAMLNGRNYGKTLCRV
jgi:NADPH-dependent curcumin reductase CurA